MKKCLGCGYPFVGFGDFCSPGCERTNGTVVEVPEKTLPAEPIPTPVLATSALSGKERSRKWREKNLDKNREYMRNYMAKRREKL